MNILLIEGSPRPTGSTSRYLLEALEERLGTTQKVSHACVRTARDQEAALQAMCASDAVVFAFPLYVDSVPSHLLRFIESTEEYFKHAQKKPHIYAIVNSGFYDARQNHIALSIMKRWCAVCGLPWGQGLAIGGGGMAQTAPIGQGPCTSHGKVLDAFNKTILQESTAEDLYSEPDFPRFLYKAAAHMGWKQDAKKNGLRVKEMKARPIYRA